MMEPTAVGIDVALGVYRDRLHDALDEVVNLEMSLRSERQAREALLVEVERLLAEVVLLTEGSAVDAASRTYDGAEPGHHPEGS